MSFKELVKDYLELKPIVYIAVVLLGLGYFSRDYIDEIKSDITNDTINAIQPQLEELRRIVEEDDKVSYKIVKWDLIKQLEKLSTDPSDVRFTDIQKLSDFCTKNAYFRNVYIPEQPDSRGLEIACLKVEEIYDERYQSLFRGGR